MKKRILAALALMAASWMGEAAAAGLFMPGGARSTQPIGHWEFCQNRPDECVADASGAAPVTLTKQLWKIVLEVNTFANASITPRTDFEMWGREEVWSYPEGYGDCEDYVLEKRRELMAYGVPASALLVTVVRQANGDGHAVLTLRTDRGDFILDNLEARVLRWFETDYTFLKRQSERSAGAWVSIEDGRATAVGSVR
jgi:predicted transglutaminase-like cysteine proteinase